MPAVRRARDQVPGDQADAAAGERPRRARRGGRGGLGGRLRSMPPTGLVILAATVLALALRLFLLTRPGFLTSGTVEYDDGVYLGAAHATAARRHAVQGLRVRPAARHHRRRAARAGWRGH